MLDGPSGRPISKKLFPVRVLRTARGGDGRPDRVRVPAGVQILPVDFRLGAGHRLFVKTSPHGTLAELAEIGDSVAFEVDHHASDFRIAWSVLMNGTLSFLDAEASAAYDELRLQPVPWPGLASTVTIQFVPETISGRGLHRP